LISRVGGGGATINNCLFTGTIDIDYTDTRTSKTTGFLNKYSGGLLAYDNNYKVTITDCISAGTIDVLWKYNGETNESRRFGMINHVIGCIRKSTTTITDTYYGTTYSIKAENADKSTFVTTSAVNVYSMYSGITLTGKVSTEKISDTTTYGKLTFQETGALTDTPTWFKRTTGVPVPYAFKDITQ